MNVTETGKRKNGLAPILEAAGMIGALVAANFLFFKKDPGYVDLAPHPTLFVVLFVLSRYGFSAGLAAALIATIGHAATLIALLDVPSFYHLLAAPYATPI